MAELISFEAEELELDPEALAFSEEHYEIARAHIVAGNYHLVEAGKQFYLIKQKIGSRKWFPWLRKKGHAPSSINFLVQIARKFEPILLQLEEDRDLSITGAALKLLSAPATPDSAVKVAVEKAGKGEHIGWEEAKQIIIDDTRAKVEAEYADKVVLTEDELNVLIEKYRSRVARAIKARDKAIDQRDKALDTIAALQGSFKPDGDPSPLPTIFDKQTSFRAMCIEQAVDALAKELQITPRQLIDIETELAERIHHKPDLAITKLAELSQRAKLVVEWLDQLLIEMEAEP